MIRNPWKALSPTVKYCVEVLAIVTVCYIYAGSPPPSVNEPHYLAKAKHYWNPDWCTGDFFLESADAHEVFYWTFGWATQFMSLPQTAWCGRLAVWSLFALSWCSLLRKVTDVRWAGLLSAMLVIPLIHYAHLSGEWLIGGVEAKGFAYPLVFFAMAKAVERRWWCVWPLLGMASSFHILVGGWAVIACLIAWLLRHREEQLRFGELIRWLIVGGCLALPGLLPALQLTAQASGEELREANITYTIRRLSHHLIFYRFAQWNPLLPNFDITRPACFGLLVLGWWHVRRWGIPSERMLRLQAIVTGSLAIAAAGFVLDVVLSPSDSLRAGIMRYYWFRLSDILVPVGTAIALTTGLCSPKTELRAVTKSALLAAAVGIGCAIGQQGFAARSTAIQQQTWQGLLADVDLIQVDDAWIDACSWIRDEQNTPKDSVFLTPTRQQTFKWYAQRPDVVTWKDVPQDAVGLNAWWRRREEIELLGACPWLDAENFANILDDYRVTHIVWPYSQGQTVPEDMKQVYRNDLFRVFEKAK